MPSSLHWQLEHTYQQLPDLFYHAVLPAQFAKPKLVLFNYPLAIELGLLKKNTPLPDDVAQFFVGNCFASNAKPIAQAYAGHQFGHFAMLGDGRATLLGEQQTPDGKRIDIQLKGNGRTHYSRRGDGKAALAPMLREYLISEAMYALGIPTTRSLAVATTGEFIYRQSVAQGAVLTRTAQSHLRVATFSFAAVFGTQHNLKQLADYAITRHFDTLSSLPQKTRYLALFNAIISRQASLIAQWQKVGFIHGVMNSDNMSICGETLDYGPCAFMNHYHPDTVFSSIDHQGRYRYRNQPLMARWNLARLAESLLPLFDNHQDKAAALADEALQSFMNQFHTHYYQGMCQKLGLIHPKNDPQKSQALIDELLNLMHQHQADFTHTFLRLSYALAGINGEHLTGTQALFDSLDFARWHKAWQNELGDCHLASQVMLANNPAIIARNVWVEQALSDFEQGNTQTLLDFLTALQHPFDHQNPKLSTYQSLPSIEDAKHYRTFCGT